MMTYYLIIGVVFIISMIVQNRLRSKFAHYSKVHLQNGMSGKEIAEKMLRIQWMICKITGKQPKGLLRCFAPPLGEHRGHKLVEILQLLYPLDVRRIFKANPIIGMHFRPAFGAFSILADAEDQAFHV